MRHASPPIALIIEKKPIVIMQDTYISRHFFFIVIKITPSNSFVSEEHEFKSEDAARDKNFTSKPEITSKITQVRQDVCNN